MQQVLYVDDLRQAASLMKPARVQLLRKLAEPHSCPELATIADTSTQKVYYHIKVLEREGLVEKIEERRVGGIMEGVYRARARSYWLSPRLVGRIGGQKKAQDQLSLGFLLSLAEELQSEVGHLAESEEQEIPSLGISARIELKDETERTAFLEEIQRAFEKIARKYSARNKSQTAEPGKQFKLMLACYPGDDTTTNTTS